MKTFLYHENGWRMIQAESLPVKPNDLDRGLSNIEHLAYVVGLEQYESEIATLKAKSIPVGNPRDFQDDDFKTSMLLVDGFPFMATGEIYEWPGDVEIKDGVAILTLPKEQQQ